jgi:3-dehydroquinate synthase
MITLQVDLGERRYPILIAPALLAGAGELIKQFGDGSRFVVITNEVVDKLYSERVLHSLAQAGLAVDKIIVPDGERQKSLETVDAIIGRLLELQCDRQTAVLALGGGVIGDLAGFAAACYMRGISFIQMPTTLLAQVDASIGGKVGVNHRLGKNMIGAFHQPRLVIIDLETLQTLPLREIVAGFAEIVKHALIRDRCYFEFLESNRPRILALEMEVMAEAIRRSCEIKSEIVSLDEREAGLRGLLNFGHTIGHALEAAGGFAALRHGEAVWAGMLAEAYIATKSQLLPASDFIRLDKFLRNLPLTIQLDGISMDELEYLMARDKKAAAGAVRMVMLQAIGEATLTSAWETDCLPEAIRYALSAFAVEDRT